MGATRAIACVLVVLLGWAASAAETEATKGVSNDELAIRAVIAMINVACNSDDVDKGVEIMRGALSDKSYVTVIPRWDKPSEAFVGDKKVFCDILAEALRSGQKWGVHEIKEITIVGPIAYEIGETKSSDPNSPAPSRWLNVFAKEDVGWKLVFSTPAQSAEKAFGRTKPPKEKSAK